MSTRDDDQPTLAHERKQQLERFGWIGEKTGHGDIELCPIRRIVAQHIGSAVMHAASFGQPQGAPGTTNMVESALGRIEERDVTTGELGSKQETRNTGSRPDVDDAELEIVRMPGRRRTHGRGVPGRVFPQVFDGRAAEHAAGSSWCPRRLEGGPFCVSQHLRRG